ncbi:MAG: hypothetical protein ABF479_04745 [Gluconacetobacter sp.]
MVRSPGSLHAAGNNPAIGNIAAHLHNTPTEPLKSPERQERNLLAPAPRTDPSQKMLSSSPEKIATRQSLPTLVSSGGIILGAFGGSAYNHIGPLAGLMLNLAAFSCLLWALVLLIRNRRRS